MAFVKAAVVKAAVFSVDSADAAVLTSGAFSSAVSWLVVAGSSTSAAAASWAGAVSLGAEAEAMVASVAGTYQ